MYGLSNHDLINVCDSDKEMLFNASELSGFYKITLNSISQRTDMFISGHNSWIYAHDQKYPPPHIQIRLELNLTVSQSGWGQMHMKWLIILSISSFFEVYYPAHVLHSVQGHLADVR